MLGTVDAKTILSIAMCIEDNMCLSRDLLLFGIALISFSIFVEMQGLGGWLIALAGIIFSSLGLLASVIDTFRSASDANLADVDVK